MNLSQKRTCNRCRAFTYWHEDLYPKTQGNKCELNYPIYADIINEFQGALRFGIYRPLVKCWKPLTVSEYIECIKNHDMYDCVYVTSEETG